jgi:triosephosphate isomerase
MSPRPILVAGNWKMHLLADGARALAADVAAAAGELPGPDVAVFPAYTLLPAAAGALDGSGVMLGAQACHEAEKGAHTGEISAAMVADAGCAAVLCGHSERRAAGATDEQVGQRARAGLDAGLQVVICVGETLDEREAGQTEAVLARQLAAGCADIAAEDLDGVELAYEPVWAIGTGKTATPEIAAAAHVFLRGKMVEKYGDAGRGPRILYGGSVKPGNAAELLAADEVRGVLVGGASLDGASFRGIIEAAHAAS